MKYCVDLIFKILIPKRQLFNFDHQNLVEKEPKRSNINIFNQILQVENKYLEYHFRSFIFDQI